MSKELIYREYVNGKETLTIPFYFDDIDFTEAALRSFIPGMINYINKRRQGIHPGYRGRERDLARDKWRALNKK